MDSKCEEKFEVNTEINLSPNAVSDNSSIYEMANYPFDMFDKGDFN